MKRELHEGVTACYAFISEGARENNSDFLKKILKDKVINFLKNRTFMVLKIKNAFLLGLTHGIHKTLLPLTLNSNLVTTNHHRFDERRMPIWHS